MLFGEGVASLRKGDTQHALMAFNQALEKATANRDKGRILCNMAICNLRLGQKDAAIKMLTDAVIILPSAKSQIEKDKDFGFDSRTRCQGL